MKHLSTFFGTTLLGLMTTAGPIRADLSWTYTAQSNVPGISVNGASPNGGANVSLVDYSSPQPGGASIPVQAYVTSTSNTSPIVFSPSTEQPTTFNLALKITDSNGASGTLNFTGSLAGTMTATSSSVVASFAPVGSNSLTFDGHTYTVTIAPQTLVAPTQPQANIMASVSVTDASSGGGGSGSSGTPPPPPPPPPSHGTPEPTSLLLGSLGFSCFGAGYWWNRRRLTRTIAAA
jgi:hypothetical protein